MTTRDDLRRAFTPEAVAKARAYRLAALADGWTSEALSPHEDEQQWSRLRKDGFTMYVVARDPHPKTEWLIERRNPEGEVHVWGPDGLAIKPPEPYSWDAIVAGLRVCGECKQSDVETSRVAFANRVCAPCLPAARAKYEKPGWCD